MGKLLAIFKPTVCQKKHEPTKDLRSAISAVEDPGREEELLSALKSGDEAAFRTVYSRYSAPLYSYALRFLGSPSGAEEAVQHTFVQLFLHPPKSRVGSLAPWLYRVCHNKCIDHQRVGRRSAPLDPELLERGNPEEPAGELLHKEEQAQLLAALSTLLPKARAVLLLRYLADFSFS